MPPSDLKDFFVSYNRADRTWAEWIAWTLEEAGYSVLIQAWDFRPGGNFVLDMQRAAVGTQRTIAVLSEAYLQSAYTQPEWAAALANDPRSQARNLIPIRVGECQPEGMLRPIVYVDLVGLSEAEAQQEVLGMMGDRAKPTQKPAFPGATVAVHHTVPAPTVFPGDAAGGGDRRIAPTPQSADTSPLPHFSTYKAETWTGRLETVAELTDVLSDGCRLLIIHGMTGIGKTALAEKLAADLLLGRPAAQVSDSPLNPPSLGDFDSSSPQTWEARGADSSSLQTWGARGADAQPMRFHRISFDIGTPSTDFTRGALTILHAIGDDTAQQLPDDQILSYLLKTLEQHPYWLQFDSLEYLLHQASDGSYHFADAAWVEFFVQLLNSSRSQTRLVLTSQALPADLVDQIYRYDQLWHEYSLRGLEAAHWLDLFRNYNITPSTDTERDHLCNIASYFQGHPLILKMIAGDIRSRLFGGSISKYWDDYYNQRQTSSALRKSDEQDVRRWVSQTIQKLPALPRQMLQRCAVFRRPVAESFYLQMLDDAPEPDRTAALTTLISRNLVEDTDIQAGQLLIQQHNLIRDSAYAQLKATPPTWETAERTAAHLWLTAYTSPPDAERIETVRGYLEAFDHYCEVEDWDTACKILDIQIDSPTQEALHWQLETWGYYREGTELYQRVIHKTSRERDILWFRGLGLVSKNLGASVQSIQYHQQSLELARETGDVSSEAKALGNLGNAYYSLGQYEQAIAHHQQYLTIAREIGDRRGEGIALGNLGNAYYSLGQYEQAIDFHQQALIVSREMGDRRGEGRDLGNLGNAYYSLGQYEQAIDFYQQYLTIAQEIGDRRGEGIALGNLGIAYDSLGQYEQAIDFHQQYLTIAQEIGSRQGEGIALGNLGNVYKSLGQYEQAIAHHQQYLTIAREIGDRQGEGSALGNWGATQIKLEQYPEALENSLAALAIFREIGDRANEAEALKILAELHQKLGEGDVARGYCEQALALATELGIPLVAECQKLKAELET